jgi:hypothetical protein
MLENFETAAFELAAAIEEPEPNFWEAAMKCGVAVETARELFPSSYCLASVSMASGEKPAAIIDAPMLENRKQEGGLADDGAGRTRGIVPPDDETLTRMSREIFRDLGIKEAAVVAYFAHYHHIGRRRAELA